MKSIFITLLPLISTIFILSLQAGNESARGLDPLKKQAKIKEKANQEGLQQLGVLHKPVKIIIDRTQQAKDQLVEVIKASTNKDGFIFDCYQLVEKHPTGTALSLAGLLIIGKYPRASALAAIVAFFALFTEKK